MVANTINNLPTGKTSVSNDIPFFFMKEAIDAYCLKLTQWTKWICGKKIFKISHWFSKKQKIHNKHY